MPTTDIPVTQIDRAGTADVGSDGTEISGDTVNGHSITFSPTMFLVARNAGVTPRTVTLDIPVTVDGQPVTDPPVTIPASSTGKVIGPFPESIYKQTSGADANKVVVTVDHADVKFLAFKV